MPNLRAFVSRHRLPVGAGALVAVGIGIFVLVWFQPQKIFVEKTVKEAAPVSTATPSASESSASTTRVVASGQFRSLEHRTTGTAKLLRLADGSHIVRFEGLDTSNGPDLRVYLSKLPPNLGWRDYGERYVELGALKGNRGDQNYRVAAGTNLADFQSVVIWCVRFAVGFGVAPLAG